MPAGHDPVDANPLMGSAILSWIVNGSNTFPTVDLGMNFDPQTESLKLVGYVWSYDAR